MKMRQHIKWSIATTASLAVAATLCFSPKCYATYELQNLRPSSLLRLSAEQFAVLGEIFEKTYQDTDFSPTLTNSYFSDSELYDMVAVPVVQTPFNSFRLELFSHIYDPKYSVYNQLHEDSVYHNLGQRQMSYLVDKTDIAVGLGFVAPLNEQMSMRTIISSHDIPGYGDSNFSVGLEFKY
ncbi:hypothetical protein OAG1_18710 [Agarivorans sp. OAG1]|uniref:Uncharacterized protein n=1 Tax=Agarivorans albus MKT 106 TaxID=1331007 RepID=R9PTB3_AGAAL|nr:MULTISPECIES: hypothetical protein [Agarivorans]MPW28465.1 hypothetical protein [Agarivorans sp. B2Z047]UQN41029.1 hypothetical protein LQZ07_14745 [Agarivorans sp. B2Z047]BEU03071.1 hypothetical protein OAG1_18710 [Agarivorans sp. OAG1]GAD02121.1 hypothetical protein AALB_2201 [Agarivorans albus MKT 106]